MPPLYRQFGRVGEWTAWTTLGLILGAGPLVAALALNPTSLDTPRLNLQRAPLKTTSFLAPAQQVSFTFESTQDDLSALELFLRPEPASWPGDRYQVDLINADTGESRGPLYVLAYNLWDDVATLAFETFESTAGETFEVTLTAASDNRNTLQLATWLEDGEILIHQPYYSTDLSFVSALSVVLLDRLSWRALPLLVLLPGLGLALRTLWRLYR